MEFEIGRCDHTPGDRGPVGYVEIDGRLVWPISQVPQLVGVLAAGRTLCLRCVADARFVQIPKYDEVKRGQAFEVTLRRVILGGSLSSLLREMLPVI